MEEFWNLYNRYYDYYEKKYGVSKFKKIREKVSSSSNFSKLCQLSIQKGIAPNEPDFGSSLLTMPYFILANSDTVAMAELIAITFWNEEVNRFHNLCDDYSVYKKGVSVLNRWHKQHLI